MRPPRERWVVGWLVGALSLSLLSLVGLAVASLSLLLSPPYRQVPPSNHTYPTERDHHPTTLNERRNAIEREGERGIHCGRVRETDHHPTTPIEKWVAEWCSLSMSLSLYLSLSLSLAFPSDRGHGIRNRYPTTHTHYIHIYIYNN